MGLTFLTYSFILNSHTYSIQTHTDIHHQFTSCSSLLAGVWLFLSSSLQFEKKKKGGGGEPSPGVLIHIQPKVTQHDRMILYLAGRVHVFGEGGSKRKNKVGEID